MSDKDLSRDERRDLLRAYKERKPDAGIYWVRNLQTGRVLLGSSLDLHGPLNRHRLGLEIGSHPCRALQRDWKELGPEAFEFAVVATVERKDDDPLFSLERALKELEQSWIARLQPFAEHCYNSSEKIRTLVF